MAKEATRLLVWAEKTEKRHLSLAGRRLRTNQVIVTKIKSMGKSRVLVLVCATAVVKFQRTILQVRSTDQ